ncbi:hypothetical protein [Novosphingobium sp.]|uniref:hypothetical protein n=1 Tax=Novosphingobium sp. TaxID=1874826 RepID=UPI0026001A77|nr:hypothetical protein [Novosphingobium sp.]
MDTITIDGLDENDFRRSIETMLRNGEADDAASKLRALLKPYSGRDKLLPERFMTVSPQEVSLAGWQNLRAQIGKYDRPEHLISALRIAVTDPDPEAPPPVPDPSGRMTPLVETSYFSDDSFPFSDADRNDLLDGYSMDDSAWQGDFEASDSAVKVEGIEDLYGSVAAIEARVMQSDEPDGDEIRAGSLGACFLAVLVHQAVRETVRKEGLPRALCVMAGNDGVYPFFDAPVLARDEYPDDGATMTMPLSPASAAIDTDEIEPEESREGPYDFSRLSSVTNRQVRKMPVIMLDAAEADLATHQFDAGAAQQLAEIEAAENAELLAVHEPAAATVSPVAAQVAPYFEELPEAPQTVAPDAVAAEPVAPEPLAFAETNDLAESAPSPASVYEPAAFEATDYDHAIDAAPQTDAFTPEPEPMSHIRALRARMTVEPEPEPGLGDRIMAAWRKVLAMLGLA